MLAIGVPRIGRNSNKKVLGEDFRFVLVGSIYFPPSDTLIKKTMLFRQLCAEHISSIEDGFVLHPFSHQVEVRAVELRPFRGYQ